MSIKEIDVSNEQTAATLAMSRRLDEFKVLVPGGSKERYNWHRKEKLIRLP